MTRQIERAGIPFVVLDEPVTAAWNFWGLYENGTWEIEELRALDRLLPDGGVLLDIGAWIGPYSLWAAKKHHATVVALEPDPEAYRQLIENLMLNEVQHRVHVENAAAARVEGRVELWSVDPQWGSSSSSTTHHFGTRQDVRTVDIVSIVRDMVESTGLSLVKCDIEGGETDIMPVLGPVLRELRIPMVLAIHPGRYDPDGIWALWAEIDKWDVTYLDPPINTTLVLEPK